MVAEALVFSSLGCYHWVLSLLSAVCTLKANPHHCEVSFSGQEQRMEGAGWALLGCEAQEASKGPGPHVHGSPERHGAPGPWMGLEFPEHPHSAEKTHCVKRERKEGKTAREEGVRELRGGGGGKRTEHSVWALQSKVCTGHTPRTFRREGWGQGCL